MSKPKRVEVGDSITNLTKYAIDLWATHLAGHDYRKEIMWGILHDLVAVTVLPDYVNSLDDIRVFERTANTEFGGNLLLIFLFGFS